MNLQSLELRPNPLLICRFIKDTEDGYFEIPQISAISNAGISQVIETLLMRIPLPTISVETHYSADPVKHIPIKGGCLLAAML